MKKKLLLPSALAILLCLALAACGDAPAAADAEMTTIEHDYYGNPVISIDIPAGGDYAQIESAIGDGLTIRNGDIDVYVGLDDQRYYVGESMVYGSFEEAMDYRINLGLDAFGEAAYAGMTGVSQDMETTILFLFPLADALQARPDTPQMLEIWVVYNVRDENNMLNADQFPAAREAIEAFLSSDAGQAILNSITLTAA